MSEPVHLLQINIISARDLQPVCKSMALKTYAVGWVNPIRKQTTRIDHKGNNCPVWNDKFIFRVTSGFLKSDATTFDVEVYTKAWLRDILVGSVRVSIASLIPTPNPTRTTRRAVALQIRRPSGRPQGILNVSVSVRDGTMQSMPLSGLELPDEKARHVTKPESVMSGLRRAKSERSWTVTDDEEVRAALNSGPRKGSMVGPAGPASSLGGSIVNSDVGPSPSVVAAAMAKGLYLPPSVAKAVNAGGRRGKENDDVESSILQWADEESEDGVMTKIERWRTELHHPMKVDRPHTRHSKRSHRRAKTEGGKLFRCFGKAYGFEFTVVCGGNQDSKNARHGKRNQIAQSDGDSNSESYIVV